MSESKSGEQSKTKKEEKLEGWETAGEVIHYYSKIGVAVIKLSNSLKVGDTIRIKGHTTDFEQPVESMQVHHESIQKAEPNTEVGIKLKDKARDGDIIYVRIDN